MTSEFIADRTYDAARIRVAVYEDEQLTGLEIVTWKGEKLLVAMSGQGLLELRDQISATYLHLPQIASWKSKPAH